MYQTVKHILMGASVLSAAGVMLTAGVAAKDLTPHQQMTRDLYAEVVATPTSTDFIAVPKLVTLLSKRFIEAGFKPEDIITRPLGDTMSLMVRYRGSDSSRKGIGFMAHMDVVTAKPEDWELDPFTLTERDGFFIGRGVSDNKAGVVSLSATFIKLKKEGYMPDRDLVLVFSGDEETMMATTKDMATNAAELLNIEFAFNSDAGGGILSKDLKPLQYGLQGAEKTYHSVHLTVTNPGGHSSRPRKDNAIYQLVSALQKVEAHQFPVRINSVTSGFMAAMADKEEGKTAKALKAIVKNPADKKAAAVLADNVMYNATLRTTCVATMLNAGHAENALPQSAQATVNCRIMPGVKPADVDAELRRIIADDAVEVKELEVSSYAPASELTDEVMGAVRYALDQHFKGVEIVPNMSTGATDGKEFRAVGIPVYGVSGLFGVTGEGRAHGLNEKIRVKYFYKSLDHWERLMKYASGGVK